MVQTIRQRSTRPAGGQDRILPTTRVLGAVIVPFLVVASGILYVFPNHTERLFAWEVRPSMTAMMLGAIYLGGAYFFTRVVTAGTWHTIHVGLLPVTAFAGLLGVATVLHWDRFTPGHVSFVTWAVLYFTTPLLVFGVWVHNRSEDPRTRQPDDPRVPGPVRIALGCFGGATVVVSLTLFLWPSLLIERWPWTLTPLTARVVGSMFVLGGAGVLMAGETRWSALRIMLETQLVMLVLVLLAVVRARDDFVRSGATVLFVTSLVVVIGVVGVFYMWMGRRRAT